MLEGDEVELGPIAEDNGQRNEVSDGEEEGDGEKRGQAENQGGVEIEAGDESGCRDEDEHEIDLANTSQTEMDESDNSALNHSSLSEGTMQFEDASNAISAMLDAAEASATGLLSTPEREKANAVADEALRIADSKRVHGTEAMGERHVDTTTSEQPIQVEQKGARRGHQESLAQNKPAQGVDPDCRGNFDIEESLGRDCNDLLFKDDGDHGANAEVSMISNLSMESSFAASSATPAPPGVIAEPEQRPGRGLELLDLESSIMSKVSKIMNTVRLPLFLFTWDHF